MVDAVTFDDDDALEPGMVIDQKDLDAKLVTLRMSTSPHFTGTEMGLIEEHYRKGVGDLSLSELQVAAGYIYLRRMGKRVSWETAADKIAVEYDVEPDPTVKGSSEI
jgi:hypothetical protein